MGKLGKISTHTHNVQKRPFCQRCRSNYAGQHLKQQRMALARRARSHMRTPQLRAQKQSSEIARRPRVFVAGASGKLGVRVVRQLANDGSADLVAGVRDPKRAMRIFNGEEIPKGYEYTGASDTTPEPVDMSNVTVEQVDIVSESADAVAQRLKSVDTVVSTLGPRESNPFDPSLPKRVDRDGTQNLIRAAESAGVSQFVYVTSLGTGRFGWPASALNLFWSILDHKRSSEKRLIASDSLEFAIVRPGGLERPTDEHEKTHPTKLCEPDTCFGSSISRKQVADVLKAIVLNPDRARNKIYEAIAEESAPRIPLEEQLTFIPKIAGGSAVNDEPHEAKTRQYAYDEDERVRLLSEWSPRGIWPEVINGRAAQLGFFSAVLTELLSGGQQTIVQQLHTLPKFSLFAGTIVFTLSASLPPALKGVRPSDANAGMWKANAELLNGRLAAFGFALALLIESKGTPLVKTNPVDWLIPVR